MYLVSESSGPTSDDDFFLCEPSGNGNQKILDLNSPDSINEGIISSLSVFSPNKTDITVKRHPSPYYYGDLYKYRTTDNSTQSQAILEIKVKKNQSLRPEREKESKYQNTNRKSRNNKKFRKSSSLDNTYEVKEKLRARPKAPVKYKSSSVETQSTDSR